MLPGFRPRVLGLALAGLLLLSGTLRAQVQVGSETQLNLDGSVSTGYSGGLTNVGPDSHGLLFGGTGDFSGSYHSPQFLNFNVSPFFNQSRNNSDYQSITDSSGVTASANIFGGSQFPGYITFSKIYNSESNYAVPGLANYAANSNTDNFGVGWSAHFKDYPTLIFGYQQGSSDYSLYGTEGDSFTHFHSFFTTANYSVAGFQLSGGVHYSNSNSQFAVLEAGAPAEQSNSDTTTYNFNLSRSIPLGGSTWLNFTRNTTAYDALGLNSSQSTDIVSGGVALKPTDRLTTQFTMDYNDNLAGTILQAVNSTGAIAPVNLPASTSHSWGILGAAQYSILQGLYVSGTISHRQQLFLDTQFDSTAYSGSVGYGHGLWGGQLTATATVSHNSYGFLGESMLGLLSNVIYLRRFGAWSVSGSFGYSQNVQTLLIAYTTSGYGYSASVSRRIGRLNWTGGAGGSKSLLNGPEGTSYFTQNYSTGLSGRWLGVSAGYSKSSGNGLITPTGITVLPPGVPPPLVTTVLYGGTT